MMTHLLWAAPSPADIDVIVLYPSGHLLTDGPPTTPPPRRCCCNCNCRQDADDGWMIV